MAFWPLGAQSWTTYHPKFRKFKFPLGCLGKGVWRDVEVLSWSVHFVNNQISYHWNCSNNLPIYKGKLHFCKLSCMKLNMNRYKWRNLQAVVSGCPLFGFKSCFNLFGTRVNNTIFRNKFYFPCCRENCLLFVTTCVTNKCNKFYILLTWKFISIKDIGW